jgi:addiction module HigA family antidote
MDIADIRRAPHPGQTLRQRLETAGLSAAALSRRLNVPTNRVTSIMNGQRSISGDTALRLAHFFQTPPDYWLGLQAEYELFKAVKEKGREITDLPTIQSNGNVNDNGWKQV